MPTPSSDSASISASRRVKARQKPEPKRRERQIVRVLTLLRELVQGRALTIRELAAKFHTRRESIYRDLRVLQDAGYPVTGDERGRLSRPRLLPSLVPNVQFSSSELDALIFAAQAQKVTLNADALSSATFKLDALKEVLQNAAPAPIGDFIESSSFGSIDYRAHESHIGILIEAILRKRRCGVTYRKPSRAEPKTYEFDPYCLLFAGGALYVIGRVPVHTGTVTLAIDRLHGVDLSQTEFEVDPAFDRQECRRDAFGVSAQDPTDIVLRFKADQAQYVRERLWHPSQEITELPGGAIQLAFRAGGPYEIRRFILGWGDAVEVISPEPLRLEIGQLLTSASFAYRG
jgi:predicted DNA-binding transcriptional regulator YafY